MPTGVDDEVEKFTWKASKNLRGDPLVKPAGTSAISLLPTGTTLCSPSRGPHLEPNNYWPGPRKLQQQWGGIKVRCSSQFHGRFIMVDGRACYQHGGSINHAVRQSLLAIFHGNVSAAVEIHEAVEGRSTTRVEFASQNDQLEQLLGAFRHAADQALAVEEQTTIEVVEDTPPALPGSENGSADAAVLLPKLPFKKGGRISIAAVHGEIERRLAASWIACNWSVICASSCTPEQT